MRKISRRGLINPKPSCRGPQGHTLKDHRCPGNEVVSPSAEVNSMKCRRLELVYCRSEKEALRGSLIIDILLRLPSPNPLKLMLARSKFENLEVPLICFLARRP